MLDAHRTPEAQAPRIPGEAVAGRILNGLGFAHTPLPRTPHFFAHTPLARLFRPGGHAAMCNRCTRGRRRDASHPYGGDMLVSELARAVCAQEGIAQRCHHLDPTRFALHGDSVPESETQAMHITHGDAKDHRPDLPPAVLALMVSQAGGVPRARQCGAGNASERRLFQERAAALGTPFARSEGPRYRVAEAKLDSAASAVHLAHRGLLTRLPAPLTRGAQVISQALQGALGQAVDAGPRDQPLALWHYGMAPRWLVVGAQAARERAEKSVRHAQPRAGEALKTPLFPWQAKRGETPDAAPAALAAGSTAWRYHPGDPHQLREHKRSERKGRPRAETPIKAMAWQRHAPVRPAQPVLAAHKQPQACDVIGTTIDTSQVSEVEILAADKAQSHVEGRVRFLKAPRFLGASLCVKTPRRIQGLLMGRTFALRGYAVTQRRLRKPFADHDTTISHQLNPPTQRPTVRWVCQLLEGLPRVHVTVQGHVQELMAGRNDVQRKILRFFGAEVCRLYQMSPG